MAGLQNYLQLRARVDDLCATIVAQLAEHLACGPGCDSCCRALALFPVEAQVVQQAVAELPPAKIERIRQRRRSAANECCPFLEDGLCLVYEARPIICRTHGLPILLSEAGESRVDFCPRNFVGLESLPGNAVIQLDQLNTILVVVNQAFVAEAYGDSLPPERVSMAEIIDGIGRATVKP